ncbi:MAG TPA: class I SAM-dependent methyltransferase [Nitrospinota bacterium]|nr:class I SAM-dependent methyltransferase [Nitrospinota bacterium]
MTELDYASVKRYWEEATPSILGPYMMDGFGFPASAGDFRFQAESLIVRRLAGDVKRDGAVLDLGSGIGFWAEDFARRFSRVTAVEGSRTLFESLQKRCSPFPNLSPIHGDVMTFEPDGRYDLVFLGGMLMYLNEGDVIALLRKLAPCIEPGGMILCRESTVRGDTVTRQGDYQVVYRSVPGYGRIFGKCGLSVLHVERNEPYVLMQMGCELVRMWKEMVPERFHVLWSVGHLTYFGLRLCNPWITHIPKALGISFPKLENHFFVLEAEVS